MVPLIFRPSRDVVERWTNVLLPLRVYRCLFTHQTDTVLRVTPTRSSQGCEFPPSSMSRRVTH